MNIFKKLIDFITGAARKIKQALTTGKDIANKVKQVVDSPLMDIAVTLIPGTADDAVLLYLRQNLPLWIEKMGWAEKKVSDFDETTLPHVLNAISAETAKLTAEKTNADLTRQQAIAAAQIIYDPKIV
jgi:hypothetical protein